MRGPWPIKPHSSAGCSLQIATEFPETEQVGKKAAFQMLYPHPEGAHFSGLCGEVAPYLRLCGLGASVTNCRS